MVAKQKLVRDGLRIREEWSKRREVFRVWHGACFTGLALGVRKVGRDAGRQPTSLAGKEASVMYRYAITHVVAYSAILGVALLMWWGLIVLLRGFIR